MQLHSAPQLSPELPTALSPRINILFLWSVERVDYTSLKVLGLSSGPLPPIGEFVSSCAEIDALFLWTSW